ncbi:MAG: type IVB secretion system protein IcmJDotN [Gammaproteobacteria bacterium]|nr:type IVB secretion system protein IcmJDotN [Gammaproteobacteria bacterium]
MYPLKLIISPENWQLYARRRVDPAFRPLRDRVFARDQYACQFCGFQAREYQEVINLDQNYRNNRLDNLATACCFCAQCSFIESVGKTGYGGGQLIYLPEMNQVELNSFCHVIFCAMVNGTGYRDTAQTVYRELKNRSPVVEDKFGSETSNPNIFGQMVLEYEGGERKEIADLLLKDLRLLPSYAKFKTQLDRWAASAAEELASAG